MSITVPPKSRPHVPPHTAHAARITYGPENPYLRLGDQLGCWLEELDTGPLRGTFLDAPLWDDLILSMVTVFQYVEHLPDPQAADAVRTRLDWKYALHLPVDHPGIEYRSLAGFRRRLLSQEAEQLAFQCLLDWLAVAGFLGSWQPRQGAREVLVTVDVLAWVGEAIEAMSQTLEAVASHHPDWLRQIALPHWYQRYGHASHEGIQASLERTSTSLLDAVRRDVAHLLAMVDCGGPPGLETLQEVEALRRLQGDRCELPDEADNVVGGQAHQNPESRSAGAVPGGSPT